MAENHAGSARDADGPGVRETPQRGNGEGAASSPEGEGGNLLSWKTSQGPSGEEPHVSWNPASFRPWTQSAEGGSEKE